MWFRVYSSGVRNRLLSGQKEALCRREINKIKGKKAGSVFRCYFVSLQLLQNDTTELNYIVVSSVAPMLITA